MLLERLDAAEERASQLEHELEGERRQLVVEARQHNEAFAQARREADQLRAALEGLQNANGCFGGCEWIHGFDEHAAFCANARAALAQETNQ